MNNTEPSEAMDEVQEAPTVDGQTEQATVLITPIDGKIYRDGTTESKEQSDNLLHKDNIHNEDGTVTRDGELIGRRTKQTIVID